MLYKLRQKSKEEQQEKDLQNMLCGPIEESKDIRTYKDEIQGS